jgi:hypothetical protein
MRDIPTWLRETISEIAHECHMRGRIHHAGGEIQKPGEVWKDIEAYIERTIDRNYPSSKKGKAR